MRCEDKHPIAPPIDPKFQKTLRKLFIISFLLVSWLYCAGKCSTNVATGAHV
ncbi:hypothetical protein HPTD01_1711 [Halomonas sp. TD01]|nr:hypothetical protein HPTD01_1711 [Halomonas sp. TD01]